MCLNYINFSLGLKHIFLNVYIVNNTYLILCFSFLFARGILVYFLSS